ncbi:MAG TPA: hypothetical protein VK835_09145 [Bacteroidia bacterium]|jgi:hypothetical protein|nr:hypothetical protein [Bacteroidia bacterium]
METVEAKTATISFINNNTLLVVMRDEVEVDMEAAIENYEIAMRLSKGNRYISLVDARSYVTITDEAKKYATQPDMHINVIAQAVVITSLATRLLANFIIKFTQNNKDVDMRLFNDYEAAQKWLNEKLVYEQSIGKAV